MGTTSSKEGSKLEDSKFITVGTAKSPEEENQESAEVAILRKVRDLAISHPILSRPASSSSTCVTEEGRRALEQSTDGAHVQWTLETAFAALSKWYSRQASAVTRQQLSLHEEVEEVSYMSKIALQNVNKSRESLKKSAADVLGLDTVTREIESLKQAVLRLQETSKHIAERLGGEEEDEEEDQPVKST